MSSSSDFLYPFLNGDGAATAPPSGTDEDVGALLADLAASARAKAATSAEVRRATLEANATELDATAHDLAERFAGGGTLFSFGNGGSSTDASSVAALFARPAAGRPLPARCLAEDPAVLTAVGNDVGFELVFVRQLIAHARAGDVAVGLSTSGSSRNLLDGLAEARRRGVLTVGLAGYDGGEMAGAALDHCLVVRSDSVHRIQEAQAAVVFALWSAVQDRLVAAGASSA